MIRNSRKLWDEAVALRQRQTNPEVDAIAVEFKRKPRKWRRTRLPITGVVPNENEVLVIFGPPGPTLKERAIKAGCAVFTFPARRIAGGKIHSLKIQ